MNRYLKYFLKTLAICLGLLLILYLVAFIYISTHKKSIIQQVTDEAGKKINGNVSIGDVTLSFFNTFPKASVVLHQVRVTDSLFSHHHHVFFSGDEVSAQLDILKLIKKEFPVNGIKIQKASIFIFTDSSGYTNGYLINPKKNSNAPAANTAKKNELKSIILKSVNVVIDDKNKGKLHDVAIALARVKLNDQDSVLRISSKINLLINNLAFNVHRGSFLKGKTLEGNIDLALNKKNQQLQFNNITLDIDKHPFTLSGWFDLKNSQPQFDLQIHTKKILYTFAKKLLSPKIDSALSIVSLDKKFDANAAIHGPLKGGQPSIHISWKVENSHLTTPFLDFENATFSGSFTNSAVSDSPNTDANSKIIIDHFSAGWSGLPVSSNNIDISNLKAPLLTADLQSEFPLNQLNDILQSDAIELKSGKGLINAIYKGPLKNNTNANSFLNGTVNFSNGNLIYAPRNVEMQNVNGKLIFKNSDVFVENLQCLVLNNKILMNGQANNLLTLMNTEPNKANINWNIYSPSLNLATFTYLLKARKKATDRRGQKRKLGKISGKIDDVLEQGLVNVVLKTDKLQYKKFNATNVLANISLVQNRYIINNVSLRQGGGSIDLKGSLVNRKSDFHEGIISVTLSDIDVSKIFYTFNNFGQNGITSQNIAGKLTANVDASFGLNDNGDAYPGSVASTVDFSLKQGALINFEPVKKLQNIIFKNRDFENIQFAELKDRLEIRNEEVKINRMEIQSSVLSLFVEGIYSMKGNTDLSIQVPLSNLKKRDQDYNPENTGTDKKTGTSLYFRARPGPDGTIQFKPDLFNKFGKEKRRQSRKERKS